ncbi:glutathione S-transferase theta-1-like [Diadema antillarum]|uniref:glutathione S-transferase theta-1-like n=1 Tax=Diadema antillarum TaxID=105358 RepID=UPI003A8837AC
MVVQVYADLGSQPCRALVVFLKHTSIPFEIVDIDLAKGEHRKPEFAAINPMMQVPAIKDGDFCLSESVAIFRYLATKYAEDVPNFWYPKEIEKRAKVDEYMAFHHQGIRETIDGLFMAEVLLPIIANISASEETIKEKEKIVRKALSTFERVFLAGKPFILGDEISYADIMMVSEMIQHTVSGRHVSEGNQNLEEYVNRVRDRLNPAFDEVFDVIYKWRADYLKRKQKTDK